MVSSTPGVSTDRSVSGVIKKDMNCCLCTEDLDHCHGTLIVHSALFVECADPDCVDVSRVRHALVVECVDLDGGCECDTHAAASQPAFVS